MNKAILIEMLGRPFSKLIKEYQFPPMTISTIQNKTCISFSNQLSGLSSNPKRMKKKIIHFINRGRVEEVEQRDSALLIRVSFQHRSELWLIELTIHGKTWVIGDLYYRGEVRRKRMLPILVASLAVLLVVSASAWGISYLKKSSVVFPALSQEKKPQDTSPATNEENPVNTERPNTADQHEASIDRTEITEQNDTSESIGETQNRAQVTEQHSADSSTSSTTENSYDTDHIVELEHSKTIHIKPGMNSQEVAQLLVENGLARTEKEMIELFTISGVNRNIQTGIFTIPQGATYLEIIELITKK